MNCWVCNFRRWFDKQEDKRFLGKWIRIAITGQTEGPPLWDIMRILGKRRVTQRIKDFIDGKSTT